MNLDAIVDAVMCCPTPEAGVFYLDVCHRIYKDGRKHIDDHSHPVYGLLASFTRRLVGNFNEWLKQQLQSTDEVMYSCLLILVLIAFYRWHAL